MFLVIQQLIAIVARGKAWYQLHFMLINSSLHIVCDSSIKYRMLPIGNNINEVSVHANKLSYEIKTAQQVRGDIRVVKTVQLETSSG